LTLWIVRVTQEAIDVRLWKFLRVAFVVQVSNDCILPLCLLIFGHTAQVIESGVGLLFHSLFCLDYFECANLKTYIERINVWPHLFVIFICPTWCHRYLFAIFNRCHINSFIRHFVNYISAILFSHKNQHTYIGLILNVFLFLCHIHIAKVLLLLTYATLIANYFSLSFVLWQFYDNEINL